MREACARVLRDAPQAALQYAASEGYAPLREWIAAELGRHGQRVDAAQVLVTTGSQQGLDLVAKVLIDAGSTVLVESPTYLGALQAFTPMEPRFAGVEGDERRTARRGDARRRAGRRRALLLPAAELPEPDRAQHGRRAARRRSSTPQRRSACRWSRTTRTASCGSTPRRRPGWPRATPPA